MILFLAAAVIIVCAITIIAVMLFLRSSSIYKSIEIKLKDLGNEQGKTEEVIKDEISRNRQEANLSARQAREEMRENLRTFEDSLLSRMKDNENSQKNQLDIFSHQLSLLAQVNEQKLEKVRATVEERLKSLQNENSDKLERMRAVVEEKLHTTLEKRLGESFKVVSDRLESVYRGLGEMQTLASSVGDLKKVLTNVKTRGVWGEIQLGALLEQILTPEQYAANVATKKGSSERVEFAVKLPGGDNDNSEPLWLPIDAKFPNEDYQRLIEAQEEADSEKLDKISKQLEARIKAEAKSIREKYLNPPYTTDFGIMFLPTEGLFAEVLRKPGLFDTIQREQRVIVTGPTTLTAVLNSLQMGFRTLAIQKRSSEVWQLLGAVKSEFAKFGEILDKTHRKLTEARDTIELASKKSRSIESRLKDVQNLPSPDKRLNSEIIEIETKNEAKS